MNFASDEKDSIKALRELGMFAELMELQSGWNAEITRGRMW